MRGRPCEFRPEAGSGDFLRGLARALDVDGFVSTLRFEIEEDEEIDRGHRCGNERRPLQRHAAADEVRFGQQRLVRGLLGSERTRGSLEDGGLFGAVIIFIVAKMFGK